MDWFLSIGQAGSPGTNLIAGLQRPDRPDGPEVISTGPYAVVRHPMYLSVAVIYISTPLALGSSWGMAACLLVPLILAARILNEEKVLCRDLPGYGEYIQKIRYRLMPFVW